MSLTDMIARTMILAVVAPLCMAGVAAGQSTSVAELQPGTAIHVATIEQARTRLGTGDDWVGALSPFDRQLRLGSSGPGSESEFLAFAASHARAWDDTEISRIATVVALMAERLSSLALQLNLPDEIVLVQTSGAEEGNAGGYTRGAAIMLPEFVMENSIESLENLMWHEVFHVMTRHNPAIRVPLYRLIGFEPCGVLEYPTPLIARRITNPDAYHFDTCVRLTVEDRRILAIPLTLSKSAHYGGGGLFDYVTVEFLEVERTRDRTVAVYSGADPVLHAMSSVEGYSNQIGANTNYIIHPEEIMADNFAFAIMQKRGLPNPEIPAGVLSVLSDGMGRVLSP